MTGSIHQNTRPGRCHFRHNYPFFGNCPQTTPEVSGRGMGLANADIRCIRRSRNKPVTIFSKADSRKNTGLRNTRGIFQWTYPRLVKIIMCCQGKKSRVSVHSRPKTLISLTTCSSVILCKGRIGTEGSSPRYSRRKIRPPGRSA